MHPFSSLLIRITSALALAVAALPMTAQAQTAEVCGPTVKEQFAVAMDAIEKKFGPDEVNPDTGLPKSNPDKENEEGPDLQAVFLLRPEPAAAGAGLLQRGAQLRGQPQRGPVGQQLLRGHGLLRL